MRKLRTQILLLKHIVFLQLFDRESCTYTYLLADINTKDAVIIDPVFELAERDAQFIQQQGLKLVYCCKNILLSVFLIP